MLCRIYIVNALAITLDCCRNMFCRRPDVPCLQDLVPPRRVSCMFVIHHCNVLIALSIFRSHNSIDHCLKFMFRSMPWGPQVAGCQTLQLPFL
jgi:hypothetical protein